MNTKKGDSINKDNENKQKDETGSDCRKRRSSSIPRQVDDDDEDSEYNATNYRTGKQDVFQQKRQTLPRQPSTGELMSEVATSEANSDDEIESTIREPATYHEQFGVWKENNEDERVAHILAHEEFIEKRRIRKEILNNEKTNIREPSLPLHERTTDSNPSATPYTAEDRKHRIVQLLDSAAATETEDQSDLPHTTSTNNFGAEQIAIILNKGMEQPRLAQPTPDETDEAADEHGMTETAGNDILNDHNTETIDNRNSSTNITHQQQRPGAFHEPGPNSAGNQPSSYESYVTTSPLNTLTDEQETEEEQRGDVAFDAEVVDEERPVHIPVYEGTEIPEDRQAKEREAKVRQKKKRKQCLLLFVILASLLLIGVIVGVTIPLIAKDKKQSTEQTASNITVAMHLDSNPSETGLSLDCETSGVIYTVKPGTYKADINETIQQTVGVFEGEKCVFTIVDTGNNGIDNDIYYEIYYGTDTSKSALRLAVGEKEFTGETSSTFIVAAPTTPLTLVIQLDSNPDETSWTLKCTAHGSVDSVPPDTYKGNINQLIDETIPAVTEGDECTLIVRDSGSNGIDNGYYEIYYGTDLSSHSSSRLIYGDGNFTNEIKSTFTVELQPTIIPHCISIENKTKYAHGEVNNFLYTIVSNPSFLDDTSTPQYKAAHWLTHEDKLHIDCSNYNISNDKQRYIQRYAMATFFYSTNGESDWLSDLNFISGDDVCQWYKLFSLKDKDTQQPVEYQIGVECNKVTHLITKIFIPDNKMSGTLPPELGLLTSLVHISLYDNDISGELPYELQNISQLDHLTLHRNNMSGQIPGWLSKLQYLRVLGLGNNNFKSSIPDSFGTMISLSELSLDDNELFGDIKVFNTLTNLKHLYLEDNYFEGEFDTTTLSKLDSLETLDLSDNNFTGVIPEHLFYLYNLRVLDLHDNYFSGDLPTFDEQNDVLKFMALHSNLIEGEIPDGINNFVSLKHVDLSLNEFTGNITDSLGDLEDLQYLFLSDNDFDEGPIPDFLYYEDLVELSLKSTNRVGEIPDWFGDFDETLLFLDLSDNELEGSIPERLTELTGLAFLLLHQNYLTGTVPDAVRDMKTLRMLTINQNSIEDDLEGKACDGDTITFGQGQVLISDCGGVDPYVACDCCTECCDHDVSDEDGGGDHDHDEDSCDATEYVPANLDPYWEAKYQRDVFVFDEDMQFYITQVNSTR